MNRKIKIVDYYSVKNFHEIINFCLLQSFCKIFSSVDYIIGKSAGNNLEKQMEDNNIALSNLNLHKRWVVEIDSYFGAFLRTLLGFIFVLKEYLFLNKKDYLYVNYNNPFALPFILILNTFLKKKVLIICHGELELFATKVSRRKLSFLYTSLNKLSFKYLLKNSKVKIIVLGKSIKNNLLNIFPQISDNVIAINHPYIFKEIKRHHHKLNKSLTIGTVGVLTPQKGLNELIDISQYFSKEINTGALKIKVIGKTINTLNKHNYKNIEWSSEIFIPREVFDKEIDSLDFILYLYPKESYKLTASGAIFDAISREKPIIALNNAYFQETIGNFNVGYLCNSLAELKSKIEYLLSQNSKEIKETFINDIKAIKACYEIDYVTNQLKSAID